MAIEQCMRGLFGYHIGTQHSLHARVIEKICCLSDQVVSHAIPKIAARLKYKTKSILFS